MTYLIVLFSLKDGVSAETYEAWATTTDLPMVRNLPSIEGFDLFRMVSVRGSESPPPFQYAELIVISDMERFAGDVANDAMKAVAAQFRQFADNPMFIVSEKLGG